jgi:hypothetical protein
VQPEATAIPWTRRKSQVSFIIPFKSRLLIPLSPFLSIMGKDYCKPSLPFCLICKRKLALSLKLFCSWHSMVIQMFMFITLL